MRTASDDKHADYERGANVLSHPAFDRSAVANARGRGRPGGAASLAAKRREKAAKDAANTAASASKLQQPEHSILIRCTADGQYAWSLRGLPAGSRRIAAQALSKVLAVVMED